jgi:hypothetical protein
MGQALPPELMKQPSCAVHLAFKSGWCRPFHPALKEEVLTLADIRATSVPLQPFVYR